MRCVHIAVSDDRMDCRDMYLAPINPLPQKCPQCGFPDLDYVPQPYYLMRSRTLGPNELAGAECGNFFIRERIRRVLDLVAPQQCDYFSTTYKGTSEPTPWTLAVPKHQVVTARVDSSISRCAACGEPGSAHPGSQWVERLFANGYARPGGSPRGPDWTENSDHDILKSSTWGSSERGWSQWVFRDLFLSVRLLHLLKRIKAKGFHEETCGEPLSPDEHESAWIDDQIKRLATAGIALHAEGTLSDEDAKWLRRYMKSRSREVKSDWDLKAIERRLKAKLPKSYLDFVRSVGPMKFENIDEQEGFLVSVLTPNKLEFENGYAEFEDDDSKAVHALTFATTTHGDTFCFDVQPGKKEFAVVLYKHEGNFFEPYAENFAACIRRFDGEG